MGKNEKFRDCPAVGRRIKPVECGQNRGLNYDCPAVCPYCPWTVANYDDFSQIEAEIDGKTLVFYTDLVGKPEARAHLNIDAISGTEDGEKLFQTSAYREYFHREYKPGKRLFDLWREAGWKFLVKNEPFLAGFKAQTRPALLEVRRVVDVFQVECVNLLDESAGVITICDRGLARSALQFQSLIGWLARYPFFHRMHGIAYSLPPGNESGLDLVRRHVREMGGPDDRLDRISDWLADNFLRLIDQITDESKKAMKTMDGHSKKDGRAYDIGWVLDELGLGEMKIPARPTLAAGFQTGWWEEVESEEMIASRVASVIANPENVVLNLGEFPDVADYFDSIETNLLNTNERDSLVKLVNYAIAIFVPEDVTPRNIAQEEMYREARALFSQLLPRGASVSESLKAYEELLGISVQKAYLAFVGTTLVAMSSASKIVGKFHLGKPVRPESILPLMIQIESFLRCLRRSSLG